MTLFPALVLRQHDKLSSIQMFGSESDRSRPGKKEERERDAELRERVEQLEKDFHSRDDALRDGTRSPSLFARFMAIPDFVRVLLLTLVIYYSLDLFASFFR